MTTVLNLTPHTITLIDGARVLAALPPTGPVPRVSIDSEEIDAVTAGGASWPIQGERLGAVHDLPPAAAGVLLIVSRMVMERCTDRDDLVTPTELVRDENGRIIGCRGLAARAGDGRYDVTGPEPRPRERRLEVSPGPDSGAGGHRPRPADGPVSAPGRSLALVPLRPIEHARHYGATDWERGCDVDMVRDER